MRLISGTALAQLITLLSAPILTRLYGPEAYGIAAIFTALTGILSVLACMRYEFSIVLPECDIEAANLLALSLIISVLMSSLTIPLIWYCGDQLLYWVSMPALAKYLWLIPLTVLISGIFAALNYWNTRSKHFMRLSIAKVSSQLVGSGTSLGLGYSGNTNGASLIIASLIGQTVATTVLLGQILRDNGRFIYRNITWKNMWNGVKRYRRFPLISSWGALINTASWQIPILVLGAFFSPVIVGFYSLGFRLIQMPMSLIGGAISQVFLQRGVEANKKGNLDKLIEELFNKMLIIGLLPTMLLMVEGADLFVFVFGKDWREAGVFTQILAPWAFIWFLTSPLSTIYIILEKQKKELAVHSFIFCSRIMAISVGSLLGNIHLAIFLFSVSGIFAYGYILKDIFFYAGLNVLDQFKKIFKNILFGIIFISPIIISKEILKLEFNFSIILSLIFLIVYYIKVKDKIFIKGEN